MHECPLFHWILILSQPLDFKSWLGHSDIWNWTIPSSVRVIRSNDNGIQEQGWVWQYFMRRPACSGQVYRCPRGSLGVPIWAASDYLEEFVILPIQAIQAIHLCWVWDRDQRVGRQGSAKGSLKIPGSPRGQQRLNWSTGGAWELRYQGLP